MEDCKDLKVKFLGFSSSDSGGAEEFKGWFCIPHQTFI
jgi:hypothetical protein